MSSYLALGGAVLILFAIVGSYAAGRIDGRKLEAAAGDRAVIAAESAAQASREAVAEAFAKVEVKNVYTTQKLEKEIVEKPVYRDCINSNTAFGMLNDALTAPEDRLDAGSNIVPEIGDDAGPELWNNGTDSEAGSGPVL